MHTPVPWILWDRQLSHKRILTFHYTGCLIGILITCIMVCYNPYITGYDFIPHMPGPRAHSLHFEPGKTSTSSGGCTWKQVGYPLVWKKRHDTHIFLWCIYIYSFEIESYRLHRLYMYLYIYKITFEHEDSPKITSTYCTISKRGLGLSPNFGAFWTFFFGAISHPAHKLMQ